MTGVIFVIFSAIVFTVCVCELREIKKKYD